MCMDIKETNQYECKKNCSHKEKGTCSGCYISTENSSHTRRCFMTGEYCSQKTNIQHERKKLYKKDKNGITISAFVIMNFSDMADVVYKWRVEVFVETIKKYLYFDENNHRLYCRAKENCMPEGNNYIKVDKINVIRADSDPASNYIICSRICQQMQIADLIIVDVSSQNPNVFYEFGMAVSLDKLILPVCFSESFYKLEIPEELKKLKAEDRKEYENVKEEVLHHIGCYPWRKRLYEYYGIRFKQNDEGSDKGTESSTFYIPFEKANDEKYGFSDIQYNRFPYDEAIDGSDKQDDDKKIGKIMYKALRESYNLFTKWDNTLVVYTIEGFLNEDQAGLCIVNFYHSITEKMKKEKCFQGERVGVLVQDQAIPDSDKDAKQERHLLYNVGEIIHIGVNQATYLASKEKVLAEDVLPELDKKIKFEIKFETETETKLKTKYMPDVERQKELQRRIKEFIGNRGMIIYPDYPVYVKRITNKTTPDILENENRKTDCRIADFFCLYHVMLRNLRFTNEIVVDITNNCLQSLFWLGAAHGAEIDAITVKQELSEKEKKIMEENAKGNNRNVFDVSGLWTAYYYSFDTEGFYQQLALAQFGIEKHSKIIPADAKWHGFKRWEYLRLHEPYDDQEESPQKDSTENNSENQAEEDAKKRKRLALESYYRRRFWNAMLRYNRLRIYLPQHDDVDEADGDPRLRAAKWDMDAVAGLTYYLSKRAVIGEYLAITMPESAGDSVAKDVNFICIGQPVKPLKDALTDYIFNKFPLNSEYKKRHERINSIHYYHSDNGETNVYNKELDIKIQVKGFKCLNQEKPTDEEVLRYHPWAGCEECEHNEADSDGEILDEYPVSNEQSKCPFIGKSAHTEIAQLILWREDGNIKGNRHFRVSLIGSSGPATFGLSSLFVDEGQKLHDFLNDDSRREEQNNGEQDNCLLYELQKKVREKIYKIVMEKLEYKIEEIISRKDDSSERPLTEKHHRYVMLVLNTIYFYLSTVLYRYFLPFLTEKDIHRIESGITMFVNTMKATRQSPFCPDYRSGVEQSSDESEISETHIDNIVKMIPGQIINVIEDFRGLEAFYKVKVRHRISKHNSSDFNDENDDNSEKPKTYCNRKNLKRNNQKDNRTVTSIEMMDEINYFMLGDSE